MKDAISVIPAKTSHLPLIFDSPHSGTHYPDNFDFFCDFKILESAEDKFIEDLFMNCTEYGATFLHAHFPRSYIDVNRRFDDIDPALLGETRWNGNFPIAPSARSHAGIGLIRRLVRPGIPVYNRALSPEEILHRIEYYYRPYHETLENLITEAHYNFGEVWHINCHSMPAASAHPRTPTGLSGASSKASDFVLGDRDGTSCSHDFTRRLREFLKSLGYTVTVNDPYKGVELVERYSNPAAGRHSLQIEVNKSLYMDEEKNTKNRNYKRLKSDIKQMNSFISAYVSARMIRLAAD